MEKFPTWLIIWILAGLLAAIICAFVSQRKVHNQPLKKRRKRLLIILGALITVFFIITTISHIQGVKLWQDLFSNTGFLFLLFFITVTFLYACFRKDKKQDTTVDNNKKEKI